MGAYRHNYSAFGEAVLAAPFMVTAMKIEGEKIMARAIEIAPEETGEYKKHFSVESGIRSVPTRRAFARVRNDDNKAWWIEKGTSDTPRFRVLGRAIGSA